MNYLFFFIFNIGRDQAYRKARCKDKQPRISVGGNGDRTLAPWIEAKRLHHCATYLELEQDNKHKEYIIMKRLSDNRNTVASQYPNQSVEYFKLKVHARDLKNMKKLKTFTKKNTCNYRQVLVKN